MVKKLLEFLFYRLAKRISEQNFIDKSSILSKSCYLSGSRLEGSVNIGSRCKIYRAFIEGKVEIGDYSSVWGPNIVITSKINPVKIGKFCSVARNVSIQEYDHNVNMISTYHINRNILDKPVTKELSSKGAIIIGNDVWIGAGAVILSGVSIGDGVVVGANSVVTKNIPDYAIVGGNPAQVIKYRFSDEKIMELKSLRWWDWSLSKIKSNHTLFDRKFEGTN